MSKIIGVTVGTPVSSAKIGNDLKSDIKDYIDEQLGDIDSALDAILDIQNSLIGGGDSPLPIEVASEEEMTALLETEEVGSVFKYVGETTDTYTKGELYIVEEVTE